jgi:hypothetical protein
MKPPDRSPELGIDRGDSGQDQHGHRADPEGTSRSFGAKRYPLEKWSLSHRQVTARIEHSEA